MHPPSSPHRFDRMAEIETHLDGVVRFTAPGIRVQLSPLAKVDVCAHAYVCVCECVYACIRPD